MNPIWQRACDLATCLCAQIEIAELPGVCFCGIVPGTNVAMDYHGDCDDVCGMAWVRVAAIYPASGVGLASVLPGNCNALIGVDIEMGIMRCMPVGESTGEPPSVSQLRDAAELQVRDAVAMWDAVRCCQSSADWIIGQYTPFGPEGGIVGGILPVNFLEA